MRYKNLKETITGIPREVIEYLESNTKLSKDLINKIKKEDSVNLKYIIFGAILSFILTTTSSLILLNYKQSETKELQRQLTEQSHTLFQIQTDYNKLNLTTIYLKTELDSLK